MDFCLPTRRLMVFMGCLHENKFIPRKKPFPSLSILILILFFKILHTKGFYKNLINIILKSFTFSRANVCIPALTLFFIPLTVPLTLRIASDDSSL